MGRQQRSPREAASKGGRLLVIALVAATLASCLSEEEAPAPASVPDGWTESRTTLGHERHLKQGVLCSQCHQLETTKPFTVDESLCTECHEVLSTHGGQTVAACSRCHQFVSSSSSADDKDGGEPAAHHEHYGTSDCLRCHQEPQGGHPAVEVHKDNPCLHCHNPHREPAVEPVVCTQCHDAIDLHHGARSDPGRATTDQCLDCHSGHSRAVAAQAACPTCHQAERGRVLGAPVIDPHATFPSGHPSCSSCHNENGSHDLRASASASCGTCHEGHQTLGSPVAEHQSCTNCHNPHDVKQSAHEACAGCHREQQTDHPAIAGSACVTCHVMHPSKGSAVRLFQECASCHEQPHRDRGHGEAGLACVECHAPHGFKETAQRPGLCAQCHDDETRAVRHASGHGDCSACHSGLPHHPGLQGQNCSSCHREQMDATATHQACITCHLPHDGALARECASCHGAERLGHHPGLACSSCHDPHAETPRQPVKQCASCHQEQSHDNPHADLQRGCASCHQPHGPDEARGGPAGPTRPPACTTCHERPKLPSLHQAHVEAPCTSCHSPHQRTPKRRREDCTTCHQKQMNHQPQAQNCASCHIFGPTAK